MKFAIVTHAEFRKTDGGLICLINLARNLHKQGHDSKLYVPPEVNIGYEKNDIFPHYIEKEEMEDERVAIYIDCTLGNPLGAKKVVRYICYGSHWYPNYGLNEITYYHAPFCKNNPAKQRLMSMYWPPGMENKGLPRTRESCYIIKKGWRNPIVQKMFTETPASEIKGLLLEGQSHEQLIEIFNTTKYFYCYDPACFLTIMALMCGCIVIQYPVLGCTAEEWMHAVSFPSLNGFTYGYENLAHAEATIDKAPADCLRFKEETDATVNKFVNDIESGNYTQDPCYPFNDSPYSIQHVDKTNPKMVMLYKLLMKPVTKENFFGKLI